MNNPGNLKKPLGILFDWDNTLVKSWDAIHISLNATLTEFGMSPWTMEEVQQRVRSSLRDSFPLLFGDRWQQAGEYFREYYRSVHLEKLVPFPGASDMLAEIANQGIYLGVVSNKNGTFLRREAEYLGWQGRFSKLVGADDAEKDKPATDPVHLALSAGSVVAGPDVWFVGDADIDMECANNAGCIPILLRKNKPANGEFGLVESVYHLVGCQELGKLIKSM